MLEKASAIEQELDPTAKGRPRDREYLRGFETKGCRCNFSANCICHIVQETRDKVQVHRNTDMFLQQAEHAEKLTHSTC